MKWLGKSFVQNLVIVLALASLVTTVGAPAAHAALTNELTTNADTDAGGLAGGIDLHLKKLSVAQVVINKMAAYYPSGDSSANGKSITISAGKKGRNCEIDTSRVSGYLYVKIKIDGTETPNSGQYQIPMNKVCGTNQFYGHTFPFPNGNLINDSPRSNYHKAIIEVKYGDSVTQLHDSVGNALNYHIQLSGNNSGGGSKLALTENNNPKQFGMRSAWNSNAGGAANNNVKAAVPFGYPCNEDINDPATRTVKLYDADAVFGDTYMWVEKNGNKLDRGDYNEDGNNGDESGTFQLIQGWDGANKRWKLRESNHKFNQVVVRKSAIRRGAEYTLVVYNSGAGASISPHFNTLSVAIPQDSIYSNGNCDYTLKPNILIDPNQYSYYPNISINASITKSGSAVVPEQHPWEVYAVRYPNAVNTNIGGEYGNGNACNVIPGGGSGCSAISPSNLRYDNTPSIPLTYSSGGPDAPGTRLCFFARIQNPSDDVNDDDRWRYTDLVCAVSGISPKLQVWGYDVVSGKAVAASLTRYPSVAYGSWGEYGLFSALANTNMASGSGLANGSGNLSQAAWSHVTGSNNPGCGGGVFGCYGGQAYPSALVQKLKTLSANPCYGNVTTSSLGLGAGMTGTRVICSTGTVTVDSNITYASTPINQALPQVIIVAKDIVINDSVSRIDSWLVAGDGNPTGGSVYTCNRWMSVGTRMVNTMCNAALTINGPVIAPRVYLGRTFDDYTNNFKTAAETINLRADTFVWASQGPSTIGAQTVSVKELPPRY